MSWRCNGNFRETLGCCSTGRDGREKWSWRKMKMTPLCDVVAGETMRNLMWTVAETCG